MLWSENGSRGSEIHCPVGSVSIPIVLVELELVCKSDTLLKSIADMYPKNFSHGDFGASSPQSVIKSGSCLIVSGVVSGTRFALRGVA